MLVEEYGHYMVCFERWMFIERSESGFLNGWGRILPTFIYGSEKLVCHEKHKSNENVVGVAGTYEVG